LVSGPSASPTTPDTPSDSPTPSDPPVPDATTDPTPTPTDSPTDTPEPSPSATSSGEERTVFRTGYGFADNDCGGPGDCLAYPPYHAGGDGTFDNPTSAAALLGDYEIGTLVYFADLGYFRIVDTCGGCKPGGIDVWVDARSQPDKGVACMADLTGWVTVTIDPAPGLPVARDFPLCGA
jgi:hypothetical protein